MSTDNPRIILSNKWASDLLRAIGIDPARNRRLIIDCEVGQPVKIYLENYGDERLYNVRMPPLEVVEVQGQRPQQDTTGMGDQFHRWERLSE